MSQPFTEKYFFYLSSVYLSVYQPIICIIYSLSYIGVGVLQHTYRGYSTTCNQFTVQVLGINLRWGKAWLGDLVRALWLDTLEVGAFGTGCSHLGRSGSKQPWQEPEAYITSRPALVTHWWDPVNKDSASSGNRHTSWSLSVRTRTYTCARIYHSVCVEVRESVLGFHHVGFGA